MEWLIDWLVDWPVNWVIDGIIDWLVLGEMMDGQTDGLIAWLVDCRWNFRLINYILVGWCIDWYIDERMNGFIDWFIDWMNDWSGVLWLSWFGGEACMPACMHPWVTEKKKLYFWLALASKCPAFKFFFFFCFCCCVFVCAWICFSVRARWCFRPRLVAVGSHSARRGISQSNQFTQANPLLFFLLLHQSNRFLSLKPILFFCFSSINKTFLILKPFLSFPLLFFYLLLYLFATITSFSLNQ